MSKWLVIQEMFCACNTPGDSSRMPVVLMCFVCLIKFMDYYESGLRHLPEKKKLKLAQQLEVGWWQELLSNQLLSTACSTSLLPHTLIKIFWSTFFATNEPQLEKASAVNLNIHQEKHQSLKSDVSVRNSELENKLQIKEGHFKGINVCC